MTMLPTIARELANLEKDAAVQAEWLTKYAAAEEDVNHPLHNARRAAWSAVRNLREARANLEGVK